jgi:formylglycine-generating enzyme required for sulfatase activity
MVSIPAATFQMGCDAANPLEVCAADQLPLHTVRLSAFRIDKYEVTNARYAACVKSGACSLPIFTYSRTHPDYYTNPAYAEFPVMYVNWNQASAFCAWEGRRLPTEAEWELAARGASDTRAYPWGNIAPGPDRLNAAFRVGDTTRVGSYPAGVSLYGALDMAGNVWEWTADWYAANYYSVSPAANPTGPATGEHKILRGGGWFHDDPFSQVSFRFLFEPGRIAHFGNGIRCAADP